MKFAVVASNAGEYADPKRLAQMAREAETAGWDGFFSLGYALFES